MPFAFHLIVLAWIQVLQSVSPLKDDEIVLGQYDGYLDDPTVPDDSNTPTFATMVLRIHNERWEGMVGYFKSYYIILIFHLKVPSWFMVKIP